MTRSSVMTMFYAVMYWSAHLTWDEIIWASIIGMNINFTPPPKSNRSPVTDPICVGLVRRWISTMFSKVLKERKENCRWRHLVPWYLCHLSLSRVNKSYMNCQKKKKKRVCICLCFEAQWNKFSYWLSHNSVDFPWQRELTTYSDTIWHNMWRQHVISAIILSIPMI